MENGPPDANFEVHFYNGVKFVYNGNRGIQVTDSSSGNSLPENYSVNTLSVDSSRQVEWAEFQRLVRGTVIFLTGHLGSISTSF